MRRANSIVQIHFILLPKYKDLTKQWVCYVPRVGDEIRLGGKGREQFYRVEQVVWVYDEDCPFDRVNIGVVEVG